MSVALHTKTAASEIVKNVEKVIVGKRDTIELVVVALLCEGHVLLDDVPGVGKTLLSKTVAQTLDCEFRRIQFTSDLLPSDVTGLNVFDQKDQDFRFIPGPLMANIVLADEINRATPRTQACLLEAMQEKQVTVDSETRPLPRPFLVMATQNPIEQEGTFPLPEAQLDRFLLTLRPGYPSADEEEEILTRFADNDPLDSVSAALSAEDLTQLQAIRRQIHVGEAVRSYLVSLVRATRVDPRIRLGASPRASQNLFAAAQALAAIQGRDFVLPDDVKALAVPVLAHRLVLGADATLGGQSKEAVIRDLLDSIPVPVD
ncbi:MAG: MoxR family ATPase [Rhodospirillales bacterium]|nr:MoxR family ATPase [Rhodospirillales bacterium]